MKKKVKVLELYSGIGGMHFALEESGIYYDVMAAADINTSANKIYKNNFSDTKLITKCIEGIGLNDLNKLAPDMLLMSPPCQPFCRVGKQKDTADIRTKSFLYILSILPKLKKPIDYILVENVKGFDTSESRDQLLATLTDMKYHVQEFLLSPLQFGIPNSRLRYFLIAKRRPLEFNFEAHPQFLTEVPDCMQPYLIHRRDYKPRACNDTDQTEHVPKRARLELDCNSLVCSKDTSIGKSISSSVKSSDGVVEVTPNETNDIKLDRNTHGSQIEDNTSSNTSQLVDKTLESKTQETQLELPLHEKYLHLCGEVGDYLEKENADYFEAEMVPEKFFKRIYVMDLVTNNSKNTCCFTKRYAHHIEGSGSIIETKADVSTERIEWRKKGSYDDAMHEEVRRRGLRFFSPREIANLMCFPQSFKIPDDMSNIQMYRVLGNSLNVHVVAVLLRLLTKGDGLEKSPKDPEIKVDGLEKSTTDPEAKSDGLEKSEINPKSSGCCLEKSSTTPEAKTDRGEKPQLDLSSAV